MTERFDRNRDLIDQSKLTDVSVIGCGGIGSALAVNLAIMGWRNIQFIDDDKLETHNLSTTTFAAEQLGNYKADAAKDAIRTYGSIEQWESTESLKIQASSEIPQQVFGKVFIGTDSMYSRRELYANWLSNNSREFFIDMRMGALSLNVATATKETDTYINTWYDDDEVEDEPCTEKHTIFCAQLAASMGMNQAFALLKRIPYYSYITHALSPPKLTLSQDDFVLP